MQNAVLAGALGGSACALIGVLVVTMHLSFIGVAIAHAAFAGALCGTVLGISPIFCAFAFSLAAVAVIGPLADRGEFNPDTPIGIVFSLTMGLAFLFMGITPGPKTDALELLWGSILTVTRPDLALLAAVALAVILLIALFFKEIQAVIFHREVALAVGLPANLIFYAILVLTGSAITVSLSSIGGLLIFNLILNPAAAAFQLTYSLRRMFLLAAAFGILSTWLGLFGSYFFHFPSGATIVLVSTSIFIAAAACSPKRRVKKL
jgi:manganese/iron transport system permease protein